jgi:hypothetical protein
MPFCPVISLKRFKLKAGLLVKIMMDPMIALSAKIGSNSLVLPLTIYQRALIHKQFTEHCLRQDNKKFKNYVRPQ